MEIKPPVGVTRRLVRPTPPTIVPVGQGTGGTARLIDAAATPVASLLERLNR